MDPDPLPLAISHADMDAANDNGDAAPLAESVPWLARYRDAWWVVYDDGWLRVTDELTAADIDSCATRLSDQTKEEPCPPPHY